MKGMKPKCLQQLCGRDTVFGKGGSSVVCYDPFHIAVYKDLQNICSPPTHTDKQTCTCISHSHTLARMMKFNTHTLTHSQSLTHGDEIVSKVYLHCTTGAAEGMNNGM